MTNETVDALLSAPTNQVPLTVKMIKESKAIFKSISEQQLAIENMVFHVTDEYLKEHPELQKFLVKPSKGKD